MRAITTLVTGASSGIGLEIARLAARDSSRVLLVASTAAFQPTPYLGLYGATKSFVLDFSGALWAECRGTGVGVTCLCPGVTATEFFDAGQGFEKTRLRRMSAMDAAKVARVGYRGMLCGKSVVVPGFMNRFLRRLVPFTPRRATLAIGASLMKPRSSP